MTGSWGRYFHYRHQEEPLAWVPAKLEYKNTTLLPYGLGRSYGDSCLNDQGTLLTTQGLNRIQAFDPVTGVIQCESGMSVAALLDFAVPRGWFIPVTPGTKFVTVGGAIANDVHGKNHHAVGSFGCFVRSIQLLRSDGQLLNCSPEEHAPLFYATIGGIGLTGLIVSASFQLIPISSDHVHVHHQLFENLDDFLKMAAMPHPAPYTVAWLDTTARSVRGVFFSGCHRETRDTLRASGDPRFHVPFDAPQWLLNRHSIRLFNEAYFGLHKLVAAERDVHYEPFFYPLDQIGHWNRLYGKRGFFQYQFVVPMQQADTIIHALEKLHQARQASFLTVLKVMGEKTSGGLLSFPMPGLTLNLDIPNHGESTLRLLASLDTLVMERGGRVYIAKDSVMSPAAFAAFYPRAKEFAQFIDPQFSSSFWRRVHDGKKI